MAANELQVLARERIGGLGAMLPRSGRSIDVRLVEPSHVLSVRMLPGGADAIAKAVAGIGIAALPPAGRFTGDGTLILWRNPTELLLVTPRRGEAERVLRTLPAGPEALAYAVDQSDGLVTFELQGTALDDVLHRLLDASAVPLEPGQGTRARMAEIAVIALRLDSQRAWLIADRANDQFLAQWVAYAIDALTALT